mmetsp:Transcript_17008/g.32272  ORF Transcript_17008/g.32272 Transcript_17008/m.32272 type:complete len:93 (-) Transcript_17008:1758-2036(-)
MLIFTISTLSGVSKTLGPLALGAGSITDVVSETLGWYYCRSHFSPAAIQGFDEHLRSTTMLQRRKAEKPLAVVLIDQNLVRVVSPHLYNTHL